MKRAYLTYRFARLGRLSPLDTSSAETVSRTAHKFGPPHPTGGAEIDVLQGSTAMAEGIVKWFSAEKGFGFIQQQGGDDVFVHISAVERAGLSGLNEGQKLEFDLERNQRNGKLAAANLRVA